MVDLNLLAERLKVMASFLSRVRYLYAGRSASKLELNGFSITK